MTVKIARVSAAYFPIAQVAYESLRARSGREIHFCCFVSRPKLYQTSCAIRNETAMEEISALSSQLSHCLALSAFLFIHAKSVLNLIFFDVTLRNFTGGTTIKKKTTTLRLSVKRNDLCNYTCNFSLLRTTSALRCMVQKTDSIAQGSKCLGLYPKNTRLLKNENRKYILGFKTRNALGSGIQIKTPADLDILFPPISFSAACG